MKNMKKVLVLALAALLLVAVGVGGTLAWLTATSGPVTNTFTPATISVNIDEHKYNKADNSLGSEVVKTNTDYLIVPGRDIKKDPEVDASSDVAFYVFVTIEKKDWLDALTYGIDPNWTVVPGKTNVYYKEVATAGTDGKYSIADVPVLKDDKVNVANTLKAEDMANKAPQLIFNAYAIQKEGMGTVAEAWEKVNPTTTTP